jgi:hypothetical protein
LAWKLAASSFRHDAREVATLKPVSASCTGVVGPARRPRASSARLALDGSAAAALPASVWPGYTESDAKYQNPEESDITIVAFAAPGCVS